MKKGTYVRQLKKNRKKCVKHLRTNEYFLACDDNVYKVDEDELWHPNYVDGNPFRSYECLGISIKDNKTIHKCDIDHCLVAVFNKKEAFEYKGMNYKIVGEDG